MGLILLSITVLTVPGLLEIGVSVFLLSIFCLIFVRCDDDKLGREENESDEDALDDVVIETHSKRLEVFFKTYVKKYMK